MDGATWDLGGIVRDIVVALIATFVGVLIFRTYTFIRKRGSEGFQVSSESGPNIATATFSNVIGFITAIAAGFVWAVENVITRYTVKEFSNVGFEVAFIQYTAAAVALFILSVLFGSLKKPQATEIARVSFWGASIFKGLNTYFWVISAALISAGFAATLENLHIVWTLIFVSLFITHSLPKGWLISTIIIAVGAALITGLYSAEKISGMSILGIILGFGSGIAFSLYTIFWARSKIPSMDFASRTFILSLFMGITGILIYPAHVAFQALQLTDGPIFTLNALPIWHVGLQAINGFVGLGLAYLLITEALRRLSQYGAFSVLLVGLGLSYSVLFTYLGEVIVFGAEFEVQQLLGVILFSIGFSAVRSGIVDRSKGGSPS